MPRSGNGNRALLHDAGWAWSTLERLAAGADADWSANDNILAIVLGAPMLEGTVDIPGATQISTELHSLAEEDGRQVIRGEVLEWFARTADSGFGLILVMHPDIAYGLPPGAPDLEGAVRAVLQIPEIAEGVAKLSYAICFGYVGAHRIEYRPIESLLLLVEYLQERPPLSDASARNGALKVLDAMFRAATVETARSFFASGQDPDRTLN